MTADTARRRFPRRRPVITQEELASFNERQAKTVHEAVPLDPEIEFGPRHLETADDADDPENPRGTTGIFDVRRVAAVVQELSDKKPPARFISQERRDTIRKNLEFRVAQLSDRSSEGEKRTRRPVVDLYILSTGRPSAHIDEDGRVTVVPSAGTRPLPTDKDASEQITVTPPDVPRWLNVGDLRSELLIAVALLALVALPAIEFFRRYGPR